jgi:type VI secretion system protein ImpK
MREEIGNLAHRIIAAGLELKERLARGDSPDLETEQARLKGLLNDAEARRYADFIGEALSDQSIHSSRGMTQTGKAADAFLGIRYALVCWLDEVFILDSPWSEQWNERKLEVELYGSNERAWKFWDQARKAETRSGDALEVFFLCVMLGFRGDLGERPDRLQNWVASAQALIAKGQSQELRLPDELPPPTNVPPLRGRDRLQRMAVVGSAVLLLAILVGSFYVATRLGS